MCRALQCPGCGASVDFSGSLGGGTPSSSDEDESSDDDESSDEGSQFPDQPVAPPGPAGPVVALNVYPAPPAFQTAQCPPQVDADPDDGSYDLPEPAQGPDRRAATCDCLSGRQARARNLPAQCDACDGGKCGELLDELLQKALPRSNDALSCSGTYSVCCDCMSARTHHRLICCTCVM